MELYRLNVSRREAGRAVPFDRLYLASGSGRKAVKSLFDYAIVMPLAGVLKSCLEDLSPAVEVSYAQGRENETQYGPGDWRDFLSRTDDWVLVSPILVAHSGNDVATPRYLTNLRWYWGTGKKKKYQKPEAVANPLPSLAYLQTPQQNYRPVCIACPRFNEHVAGKCTPGMRVCLESLMFQQATPVDAPETTDLRAEVPYGIDSQD